MIDGCGKGLGVRPAGIGLCLTLVLVVPALVWAARPPFIDNGLTTIEALGERGEWTGVDVKAGAEPITTIELTSAGRWTASRAVVNRQKRSMSLTLRGFDTSGTGGTPELAPSSFVRFTLAPDDPFPRVDFRFEVRTFEREAWESAWSAPCPLHFLRCSSPQPEIYYFHGLLAPTPRSDPYPFSWQDMRANWADGWSTAPAIGALTVPAVALWTPSTGHMVGYSFQHARSTDKSSKHISVAYCWGTNDCPGDAIVLIWPYQRQWQELTYPSAPTTAASHFDLLHASSLGPTEDVNELVLSHTWQRYGDLLPAVPRMNDLGWMVERHRLPVPAGEPTIFAQIRKADGSFCSRYFRDGTQVFGGDFRAVDLAYRRGNETELTPLRKDVNLMLSRAIWETIDGDECCYWKYPFEGGWDDWIGGEAADTTHNVQQFGFGGALLAMYLHEPSDRLWRHVEGLYNWARHYVYTRGDICDIPCSMFTLQTSRLALDFLMNLHYSLRDDPDPHRRGIGEGAFGLARTVVWRNANVTTDDPDESDTLDPTFLMPGNHARFWLGQVSWAELCDVFRSMIVMYVESGDPRLKYYVRGALEKWHGGFEEDGYHTAENLDVFGETAGKGERTGVHGPQESFWEWAQPVGDTILGVTAGRAAAIAFCKGTTALDVAEYRFQEPCGFRFKITGEGDETFSMVFSSPFRDLSDLAVLVDGEPALDVKTAGAYREHLLFTVHPGAVVEIGDIAEAAGAPFADLANVRAHAAEGLGRAGVGLGMECLDLGRQYNTKLSRSWDDQASWAGLSVGRAFACGVPYVIQDPDLNDGKIAVRKTNFRVWRRTAAVFLVCSKLARQEMTLALTTGAYIPIDPADGICVRTGRPLRTWELWLYPVSLPRDAEIEEIWVLGEARLFAVTIDRRHRGVADGLRQVIREAREREVAARDAGSAAERMVLECRKRVLAQLDRKHIRAALLPPHGPPAGRIREALDELRIPSIALRPEEVIDPEILRPTRYPILIYTSPEHYLQSVKAAGDAEDALLGYLRAGGTLAVMGACRPFTYADDLRAPSAGAESPEWALLGREFGLDLLGPDERRDDAIGFEQVPDGKLILRLEAGQDVLSGLPEAISFPSTGDRRFRPASGGNLPPEDEFDPILTLYDEAGTRYGPAMAVIRRHSRPFAGANILWVWGSLISDDFAHAEAVVYQSLTRAAEMCGPSSPRPASVPPTPDHCPACGAALPEAAAWCPGCGEAVSLADETRAPTVGILPLADPARADLIKSICSDTNTGCIDVSEDLFVDRLGFSPARFPIAVHAPREEGFVNTWRLPEDGADAYRQYLEDGGFLIACGNATQFWYPMDFEAGEWLRHVPVAPTMPRALRLPLEYGFERPEGKMVLQPASGKQASAFLPRSVDVTEISDQRWRALAPVRGAATQFTPLAYLTDGEGERYNGYAAGLIRRGAAGGRAGAILYVWGNLIEGALGEQLMRSALRLALAEVQESPP